MAQPPIPIADFDIDGPGAGLRTLDLLLLPLDTSPSDRLTAARQWFQWCYQSRMMELGEKALRAAEDRVEDRNPEYTLGDVIKELGFTMDEDQFLAPFVLMDEAVHSYSNDERDKSERVGTRCRSTLLFHVLARRNVEDHRISHGSITDIDLSGDRPRVQAADLSDYILVNEAETNLVAAMSPGLTLVVVACLQRHHPDETASRTLARAFIKEVGILDYEKPAPRTQRKYRQRWTAIAPLWAGVIAEAGCWNGRNPIDWQRLRDEVTTTLATPERRRRAFEYARWFIEKLRPVRHASGPIIDKNVVIRIPESIAPREPELPKLDGNLLLSAKKRR